MPPIPITKALPSFDPGWRTVLRAETPADFLRAARYADAPVVLNAPPSAARLEAYCILLGRGLRETEAFGEVRDIHHNPANPHSVAESLDAHPPHTDGTFMEAPPSAFLLHFVTADPAGGGVSTFIPLYDILGALAPADIKTLALVEARFARRDQAGFVDAWQGPLLAHDETGHWRFRWRYDDQVYPRAIGPSAAQLDAVIAKIRALTLATTAFTYQAKPGDLVWVPNQTWLHGRTALSPASDRRVLRAWIA